MLSPLASLAIGLVIAAGVATVTIISALHVSYREFDVPQSDLYNQKYSQSNCSLQITEGCNAAQISLKIESQYRKNSKHFCKDCNSKNSVSKITI